MAHNQVRMLIRPHVRFGSLADIFALPAYVRFTPKADMCAATRYVRFVPMADIGPRLFDHFVGKRHQRRWNVQVHCLRGF